MVTAPGNGRLLPPWRADPQRRPRIQMLQTLTQHAALISAAMTCVTALIWIVYLSFFLRSYRRQQRPSILITSGGGRDLDAHCFVTNLGLEPVYLLDVVIDLIEPNGNVVRAVIPERNERWNEACPGEEDDARRATNVGALSSGGERDLGRFRTLIDRACTENPAIRTEVAFKGLEVTVITVTASQAELCGASRCYRIEHREDGKRRLRPQSIKARQLQGYFARKSLTRLLTAQLDAEDVG